MALQRRNLVWMFARHLFAIAVLPFTVTVLVPLWLARRYAVDASVPESIVGVVCVVFGVLLLAVGVSLFATSLHLFATEGKGTLAPWDPPRRLVIRGPYRYVRNPMISGVVFLLFAEGLLLRSLPHTLWALLFVALNLTYIPLLEEPQLEARFGDDYREYRRDVPRIFPRMTAWRRDGS